MTRPLPTRPLATRFAARALPLASLLLALGACTQPVNFGGNARSAAQPPNAAATTACRAEVDRVYAAQNRADLSTRDERDTPFAANYLPGVTTQGLGARYGRDNMMGSCLDNAATARPAAARPTTATTGANPGPTFSPISR